MKRLAFLSPLPGAASGIADYAADVLRLLAPRYAIDAFHARPDVEPGRLPASVNVLPVEAFDGRHHKRPYHLALYQMGNGDEHAFLYGPLARVPGLLVLHDLVLHHARARAFLAGAAARAYGEAPHDEERRTAARAAQDRYAAEVAWSHPHGYLVAQVHLETVGDLLPYAYPLFRLPVESSRRVAVHNLAMARAIREAVPSATVDVVPMPMEALPVAPGAAAALRARHGLDPGAFVVGTFGLASREKRIETVARAVARVAAAHPHVRLLVAGEVPDERRLRERLHAFGVADRTILAGRVPFEDLGAALEAMDAVVHLRYPTARETSAALLRVLAHGRPTVMADLENFAEVPADAVLRADIADEEGEVTRALLRLVESPGLRGRLGERARDFVRRVHAPEACVDAHVALVERAIAQVDARRRLMPAHWGHED